MNEELQNQVFGTRDYEVSVWTLQDSYITTLKWSGSNQLGTIQDPKMSLSDDGTENFTFSIPMYLWNTQGDKLVKKENPIWYTVSDGIIEQNMRKIKVIFNKKLGTSNNKYDNRVFEFLITKVEHSHEKDELVCDVTCEGLAFHELGKQGYKLELSGDLFNDRDYAFFKGETWYDNFGHGHRNQPFATLDYWMDDIGIGNYEYENNYDANDIFTGRSLRQNYSSQKWYYLVDMDVSSFAFDENGQERSNRKIYDESYAGAWEIDGDKLKPKSSRIIPAKEKERMVDASESNLYNLTQTIAETFNVFCRYEYSYDDNYHIIGRTIIFYNNFLKDAEGEEFIHLTYPHSSISIKREYDSTDITTKMFVRPESDDTAATGEISIIDTDANPTKEDYIMNFDYLHKIGTISDEQYAAIEDYKIKMHDFNEGNDDEVNAATLLGVNVASAQMVTTQQNGEDIPTIITVNGIGNVIKYNLTFKSPYTPQDKDVILYKDNEYIYDAINTAWYMNEKTSILGLTSLQEMLIVKQEEKVDVDAYVTSCQSQYDLAVERLADAQKRLEGGILDIETSITELSPVTALVSRDDPQVQEDTFFYQCSLSGNHMGIIPDSIRVYEKWDSKQKTFNPIINSTIPPDNPCTIGDWLASYPDNAVTSYVILADNPTVVTSDYIRETVFPQWLEAINKAEVSFLYGGIIPGVGSRPTEIASVDDYNVLTDAVGWIVSALGYGKMRACILYEGTDNEREMTLCTSLKFNGETYTLQFDENGGITSDSWGTMVAIRKMWCLQYIYGIEADYLSPNTNGIVSINLDWVKVPSSTLHVSISDNGLITWSYSGHSARTLQGLWATFANNEGKPSFELWCKNTFGSSFDVNEIKVSQVVMDSSNNPIKLKHLGSKNNSLARVYLTYDFNPTLHYTNIKNQWEIKIAKMQKLLDQYTDYQTELEESIDKLEVQIRNKLQAKNQVIADFNAMMGPALRESYWQPENYQDYGDIYSDIINRIHFDARAEATVEQPKEDISAKFIWDSELFAGEEKGYYQLGVNEDDIVYYPCINLKAFINGRSGSTLADKEKVTVNEKEYNIYENLESLCFSFYNDIFDREVSNGQTWAKQYTLYANANGWYYKKNVTTLVQNINSSYDYDVYVKRSEDDRIYYVNGASMNIMFIHDKQGHEIIPILMIKGMDELSKETLHFVMEQTCNINESTGEPIIGDGGVITPGAQPQLGFYINNTFIRMGSIPPSYWVNMSANIPNTNNKRYEVVYPRIRINSLQLNQYATALTIHGTTLATPDHYSIFTRHTDYYLTIKPNILFTNIGDPVSNIAHDILFNTALSNSSVSEDLLSSENYAKLYPWRLTYTIKNGGTYAYLDAERVLKENSVPKVAYTIQPNVLNKEFVRTLYNRLGQIAIINDTDLKLEKVFGYISSLELDLDHPWEDNIEIKNYKNKFEDLFSNITAQVEEMKKNAGLLASFNAGDLHNFPSLEQYLQGLIEDTVVFDSTIINEYLNSHFNGREIVEQELSIILNDINEVLVRGEAGLQELYTRSKTSSKMLASFAENINLLTQPKILTGDPNTIVNGYKPGDVLIGTDGKKYIAMAYPGESEKAFAPYFDGTVSKIVGANVEWDAETGVVDIKGENLIDIKSGSDVTIAAGSDIYITGNRSVNIGGATVNIGSVFETETKNGEEVTEEIQGGINIISSCVDLNNEATSGIWIKPTEISMLSSNIIMKGSKRISMYTSTINSSTHEAEVSGIQIDQDTGIYIGSSKGIDIYAGAPFDFDDENRRLKIKAGAPDAVVSIYPGYILLGAIDASRQNATSMKVTPDCLVYGLTNNITNLVNNNTYLSYNNREVGLKITPSVFSIATEQTNSNYTYRTLLELGGGNNGGLIFAYAKVNTDNSGEQFVSIDTDREGVVTSGTTNTMLQSELYDSGANKKVIDGSFVKINKDGITLGSGAKLWVNTNNLKIQNSRFAIGNNLNDISVASAASVGANFVGMLYNENGLFVQDVIISKLTALGSSQQLIIDGSTIGFYTVSSDNTARAAILTISSQQLAVGENYTFKINGGLDISADNVEINSNVETSGSTIFRLGSAGNPSLTYKIGTGLTVSGNITATTLSVGTAQAGMSYNASTGLKVTGGTISSGSINIGNGKFFVNTDGALSCTGASIGGSVTISDASTVTSSLTVTGTLEVGNGEVGDTDGATGSGIFKLYYNSSSELGSYIRLYVKRRSEDRTITSGNKTITRTVQKISLWAQAFINGTQGKNNYSDDKTYDQAQGVVVQLGEWYTW